MARPGAQDQQHQQQATCHYFFFVFLKKDYNFCSAIDFFHLDAPKRRPRQGIILSFTYRARVLASCAKASNGLLY